MEPRRALAKPLARWARDPVWPDRVALGTRLPRETVHFCDTVVSQKCTVLGGRGSGGAPGATGRVFGGARKREARAAGCPLARKCWCATAATEVGAAVQRPIWSSGEAGVGDGVLLESQARKPALRPGGELRGPVALCPSGAARIAKIPTGRGRTDPWRRFALRPVSGSCGRAEPSGQVAAAQPQRRSTMAMISSPCGLLSWASAPTETHLRDISSLMRDE